MRKVLLYLSVATVLFASCAKDDIAPAGNGNLKEVNLLCAVGHAGVSLSSETKGVINPETELAEDLEIAFLRADRIASGFNPDNPWEGLEFKNNIPSADQDKDQGNPKYKDAIQYYWSKAKVSKTPDADYYRRVTDFTETQYFKGLDDYAQYLAWYPCGTVASGDGTQPFSITQGLDLKTDVMFSNLATESITGDLSDTLLFKHALCQFRIHVYRMQEIGDDGEFVTTNSWGYLKDIVVQNNTKQMTYTLDRPDGTVTYNYDSRENLTLSEQHFPDSPGTEGVFFKPYGEILVGYDQRQYVACFLAAPPKEGILQLDMKTVKNLGAEPPLSNSIAIASDFQPGYAYDVVLCFSDHGIINAEASLTGWSFKNEGGIKYDVTAKMYYDLSRYGTANSYIVASSNVGYTFKGNVKGCGNENGGATVAGCNDWTLPEDSYIDILYTSDKENPEESQLLKLDNHQLIDGNITFTVPGNPGNNDDMTLYKKGNAIIAAYDYQGGNILWSWHIWFTDRPKDQGYGSGFSFMDRNLGALVAPTEPAAIIAQLNNDESTNRDRHGNRLENGFYYQWGRKDPIIPGWSQYSGDQVDIATATKNVNTFYGASRSGGDRGWHITEVGVDDSKLWGYSSFENMVKSVYDPCPPGYRLPEHNSWFKKFNGVNFIDYHNVTAENYIATHVGHKDDDGHLLNDDSGNGCTTTRNYCAGGLYTVSGTNVWYPGTGWIYAEKAPTSGTVGPYSTETNVYAANNAYSFNAVKGALDLEALIDNADACPVRCVSVNSVDMVTNLSKTQTANCYIIPSAGDYKFKADVKGNGANRVSVSGTPVTVLDVDVNISHSKASFYTVLWWQGDLSGADGKKSNESGRKCPIKFANSGKRLPASPGRTAGSDFTDDDITVMDSDGFIQFRIEESDYCHGNAIVAAFDVNNNILWSWHLWLTDEPSNIKFGPRNFSETYKETESSESVTINSTKTYYAMDRNLGSTFLPQSSDDVTNEKTNNVLASYGMYYQWGRKDPFPGPSAVNVTGESRAASSTWWKRNVSGNFAWTQKDALESANPVASREDAIPTPTTFYKNNFTNVFSTLRQQTGLKYVNWHTTDWEASDNRSKYISMWGCSSDSPKSAYNPRMSKTINDPCPPGYYIPDHYLFAAGDLGYSGMDEALNNGGTSVTVTSWSTSNNYGVFINANGHTYEGSAGVSAKMWLPYAGYRNGIDGQMMNTGSYNMYGSSLGAALFGVVLGWFGIDAYSHIAAQYHCAMDFNAFSKNSQWGKTYVRALSVRPTPTNTSVIQAGQLANLPADGTPIRCRAY